MDRGEWAAMETGVYKTLKATEKENDALKKEIKVLAKRILDLRLKAEDAYIRGYKEGRRTANEGGMN